MTSPLLQAVHQSCGEALALATHFATSSDLPPASLLKQRAADLLDRMAATASKAGLCAEDIGDIQYALVAFMDEQILKSPWDGKQDWMVEPLQLVYFNETTAGEGFFTRLREIETRPERAHVLLAYYLCLVLGFQGVYAIRDHRAIDEHLASVASRLSTLLPELDSISPHGIPSDSGRQQNALKAYLMLTEVEHLDPAWATKSMGAQWADQLGVQAADRSRTEALIGAYFAMQKEGRLAPAERDDIVTEQVRGQLRNTPRILGDYERLMQIVRPGTAPISRTTVFGATAANQFITARKGVVVDGVYTRLGWSRVRKELDTLQTSLGGEAWVLGDGALDPKKVAAEVRTLYFEKQAHAWEMFLLRGGWSRKRQR